MSEEKTLAFLTTDWSKGTNPLEPNGCAWYRCFLPMEELDNLGWNQAMAMPEYNNDHGFGAYFSPEQVLYGWDIIVFKLVMLEKVANIMETQERVNGQKIVVDVDDFFEGLPKENLAYKTTDPENNPTNNRNHYESIIKNADAIITSTPFLYDFYKNEKGYKNVFLVRNAIDINRWRQRKDHSRGLPTVGWVGATPWRSSDLQTLNPFLGEFLQKNRLGFHHAGHIKELKTSAADMLGIPESVKFTHEPRKPISKYPEMFRKIDIGIVPLNDIKFNYAKSTIKGLEYTAAGIPFVASYSPEYEYFAQNGIGRVAHNEQEWVDHLEELLDPKVRQQDVERNRENVIASHTMSARAEEWNTVMNNILEL